MDHFLPLKISVVAGCYMGNSVLKRQREYFKICSIFRAVKGRKESLNSSRQICLLSTFVEKKC